MEDPLPDLHYANKEEFLANPPDVPMARFRLTRCFSRKIIPDPSDMEIVLHDTYRSLMTSGAPVDDPGDRLYILRFEGHTPYVKVGHTTDFFDRLRRHEHDGQIAHSMLFDGWVSPPIPDARPWEKQVVDALVAKGFSRVHEEYFYETPFATAVDIARTHQPTP